MILNKHGWGLRDMLIYSGIIIIFFFIAIYFIVSMYHEMGIEVTEKSYDRMEEQLEENALIYLNDYYQKELDNEGIIVDPPRSGLSKDVIEMILKKKPKKVIYVSCDIQTLIRDIKLLEDKYEVKKIYAFDMFSYTYHVECCLLLSLKEKNNYR